MEPAEQDDAADRLDSEPPQQEDVLDDGAYPQQSSSSKRAARGNPSSIFAGSKMPYLKKDDGIPLLRSDIQYDFLQFVFRNQTRCFTQLSDKSEGHTFAEVYIDAMVKSSKCSKNSKDVLLQDTDAALCMAMVCLLINVGRMNTTLNCER